MSEEDNLVYICNIRGKTGDRGPIGPQGTQGPKGEKGDFSGDYNDLSNKPDFYSKDEVQDLINPLLSEIKTLKEQIRELTNNKADKSDVPIFIDVATEAEAQSTSTANPDAYITYTDK